MMTEMDEYSLRELRQRGKERWELEQQRLNVNAALVDSIREIHSRGYTDQEIADALGMQRKVVNSWRLHGQWPPPGSRKKSEAPALDSAGKGQGNPV